jgi:hypothetical protein
MLRWLVNNYEKISIGILITFALISLKSFIFYIRTRWSVMDLSVFGKSLIDSLKDNFFIIIIFIAFYLFMRFLSLVWREVNGNC